VKKQYRKLALQYHPDRNAGKEEEYIPKFQAIQAAHEVLGEPGEKGRYDGDRRKAGLYPTSGSAGSSSGTRGNPYQATSAYPPPPRRTQPGTYQRPQAAGADRFTNFPRSAPTAKRADPTAERQNAFKAWQNMNNAQDRQQQQQQQQQQSRYAQANAQAQAKTASPRRPVPVPPPRAEPKFPTDEKIRAGFNYREAPNSTSADGAEERQSAWAAFQASRSNVNPPGVKRSNTSKTPKKAGFDPNMPGTREWRPIANMLTVTNQLTLADQAPRLRLHRDHLGLNRQCHHHGGRTRTLLDRSNLVHTPPRMMLLTLRAIVLELHTPLSVERGRTLAAT
jgi:hypothetical protein